jgi:peptidoglycan/LPS O-acetylase OafA/YrhL
MRSGTAATAPKRMLEPLTSFRFVAALMVFAQHAAVFGGALAAYELGFAGVAFFFVLSGFILTYVYLDKLRPQGAHRKTATKKFYAARFAKMYPVHFLMLLLAVPYGIHSFFQVFSGHLVPKLLGTSFLQLTMTQSYFPNYNIAGTFDGPAWSISTEFFFYIVFPALIFALLKYRHKLSMKKLVIAWTALWVALLTVLAMPFVTVNADNWTLNLWLLYMFPVRRLLDFVLGIILGLGFLRLTGSAGSWLSKIRKWQWTAMEILAITAVTAATALSIYLPHTMRHGAFLLPFWGLLIFVFAWQSGWVSKVVSCKPLLFLGNISFSFYMTHWLVLQYAGWFGWNHDVLYVPAALAVSLAIATAMYLFYEEPVRRRVKAKLEQANLAWLKKLYRNIIPRRLARPGYSSYSYNPESD